MNLVNIITEYVKVEKNLPGGGDAGSISCSYFCTKVVVLCEVNRFDFRDYFNFFLKQW